MRNRAYRRVDDTSQVTPQDPWAAAPPTPEPPTRATTAAPPSRETVAELWRPQGVYVRGVAHVKPITPSTEPFRAPHEPTGTGWPGEDAPEIHRPMRWRLRQLRRGGRVTTAAALFAFVCWGLWAVPSEGELATPAFAFALTLLVAAGLFALTRLVGRFVLENQLGRVRRSARGAHFVTAVFLFGVGVSYLRQIDWVVEGWNWVRSQL